MSPSGRSWYCKLGRASSLVMSGALARVVVLFPIAFLEDCALAQITPDATLGVESSVVTPANINGVPSDQIDGGAIRGANLFHSFREFNIGEGLGAYFTNPAGIANILSRVTGNDPSDILGRLGVLGGNANLFLINPNGIIFGSNASLDVGGSFVGSTASSLNFADGNSFSATARSSTPLLTISVPIGLQYGGTAESILNQSQTTNSSGQGVGLQVQPGKTLALIGGDVRLVGGQLRAPGAQIELGGVASSGTVGLQVNDNNLRSEFSQVGQRANVSLSNGSNVDVTASNGGSIAVNARNLDISGGSRLAAGIGAGLGAVGSQAGNIDIDATDTVTIDGTSSTDSSSRIVNTVLGTGSSGHIVINTGSLNVIDKALIGSATNGQGNAGSVTIQARDAVSFSGIASGLISAVAESGVGNTGGINIQTRELSLTNGAQLAASTLGQGNAGNVQVNATDSISVSGGSNLNAITGGQGNAGNVNITAGGTVSFDGVGTSLPSGILTIVGSAPGTVGERQGGDINIQAGSLSLTNGARLDSSSEVQGNAGNIKINAANSVSVSGGSNLQAATYIQGDAGDINISAGNTVSFDGLGSTAASFIRPGAVGEGGDLNIQARSLSLTNGAQLLTSNFFGQGNAGNIQVNVTDSVSFSGGSGLKTLTSGQGNAGNVTITAGGQVSFDGVGASIAPESISGVAELLPSLQNGLQNFDLQNFVALLSPPGGVFSGVLGLPPVLFGNGKGGDINIRAESFSLNNGAFLFSSTYGQGDAGSICVQVTDSLSLTDSYFLSNTLGQGDAGSISVQASDLVSLANSFISSRVGESGVGNGADINIQTRSLSLNDGAEVEALTRGKGNAGNIRVNAIDSVDISGIGLSGISIFGIVLEPGYSSGLFTSTEATASGQGGEIRVATGALRILDGAVLSARTRNAANGGNIFVNVNTLEALNGGQILTTAFSSGSAGNITVDATNSVTLSGSDPSFSNRLTQSGPEIVDPDGPASGLFARTQDAGTAGNLTITTGQLQIQDGAQVTVSGEGSGNAGNLEVEANSIRLSNRANITANTRAGQGNINLHSEDLVLRRGSNITTNATGTATGGNITIDTDILAALENSDISANAQEAFGGRVRINAQGIFGTEFRNRLTPESDITATSELGFEFSGTVEINTPDVDPNQGLINLPNVPIDTEVVQACTPGGSQQQSEFVITGRGGLPPNPGDALSTDAVMVDLVTLNPEVDKPSTTEVSTTPTGSAPARIVEAQSWVIDANGNVVLVANAPTVKPHSSWQRTADCRAFNQQQGR